MRYSAVMIAQVSSTDRRDPKTGVIPHTEIKRGVSLNRAFSRIYAEGRKQSVRTYVFVVDYARGTNALNGRA